MSQPIAPAYEAKSPLDAAQKIVAELSGMTKENQTLALRFAVETLRLEIVPGNPGVPFAGQGRASAPAAATAELPPVQPTDIKAFTAAKEPKSDQQFATVVAYYYQFEAKPAERKPAVDPETMKEAARLAGWPQVKRWAMTLTNAKNAGYLDSAGDGKFRLSSVGENLVAITLPGNAPPGRGSTKTRKKQAVKLRKSSKNSKKVS